MAENSKIEWCEHTFNPWRGCTKVSPGCAHCYAETLSKRNPRVLGEWGPGKPRVLASEAMWQQPLKWNREAGLAWKNWTTAVDARAGDSGPMPTRPRVFCASLADWLDDEVPIEWLARLLQLIHDTPNLDWLLLTKRPQNWAVRCLATAIHMAGYRDGQISSRGPTATEMSGGDMVWIWGKEGNPPANVWIGTTVEDQARVDERIPHLLQIPAKVLFLSCEPLLGHVAIRAGCSWSLEDDCGIHWVICGGESGPHARPMHPDWARGLRDQCRAAGVPFFFKQWGSWTEVDGEKRGPDGKHVQVIADSRTGKALYQPLTDCLMSDDGCIYSLQSLPAGKTARLMRRAHKAISGRLLDGREWDEFPKVEGSAR